MSEAVIAIVFDFDETLGPDTISTVVESQGVSVQKFWQRVNALVEDEWDPPLAYMRELLELQKKGKLDLSQKSLKKIGAKLKLFPGLPLALQDLKEFTRTHPLLIKSHIHLEMYIISGGLEDVIRSTKIAPLVDGIFASRFAYENDQPVGIKSGISFTEKTRFLHGIRKGIDVRTMRRDPYRINDAIPSDMVRIPFTRMIYIGDGPSDIPCLSPVVRDGGVGIGVSAPFGTFKKGYELAQGKRITVGPYTANYKKGSDMRKVLEETVLRIGLSIDLDRKKKIVSSPGYS